MVVRGRRGWWGRSGRGGGGRGGGDRRSTRPAAVAVPETRPSGATSMSPRKRSRPRRRHRVGSARPNYWAPTPTNCPTPGPARARTIHGYRRMFVRLSRGLLGPLFTRTLHCGYRIISCAWISAYAIVSVLPGRYIILYLLIANGLPT